MSSDENKSLSFDKPKKNKNRKSIGWIIGVVVLILISITFILPTTFLAGNNDIVFGSIRGKDISYTNQYFQTQASFAQAQLGSNANSLQGMYQVFNQAFLSTAATIALNDMADEVGIAVTDNYVDRAIVNSGFYNNADGVFDAELYNNADRYQRDTFRAFAEESVASGMVTRDIMSAHSSNDEVALIQDLGSRGRTFDYVTVSSAIYPRESVISYALEHQDNFLKVGLNSASYATEEEANTALSAINDGSSTLLEQAETTTSTTDGEIGGQYVFALQGNLVTPEDIESFKNAAVGDIIGPVQTVDGYTIYEVTSAPVLDENATEEELNAARSYIATAEPEMMSTFLDEKTAEFEARISNGEDFFTVAEDMGLNVTTVSSTTANPNSFPLFSTFQMTDPAQNLFTATYFNANYINDLYQGTEGDVLAAENLANGNRLITRIGEDTVNNSSSTYVETMYGYLKPQMATVDLQTAIFNDPTFEDNFASTFFSRMLQTPTASN